MLDFFSTNWFWFLAIAYYGANCGGYIASKDPNYSFVGILALLVKVAAYVFVVLLFWKLEKWYYPLLVFGALSLFDIVMTRLHSLIHIIIRKEISAFEYRVLGVIGTLAAIVFIVLAYVDLL